MSILLADAKRKGNTAEAERWLGGDCRLVVVAGRYLHSLRNKRRPQAKNL